MDHRIAIAEQLENESKWEDAALMWLDIGRVDDYEACMSIHRSVEKGNNYRAEVELLGPKPDPEKQPKKYFMWFEDLSQIYIKHFGY